MIEVCWYTCPSYNYWGQLSSSCCNTLEFDELGWHIWQCVCWWQYNGPL